MKFNKGLVATIILTTGLLFLYYSYQMLNIGSVLNAPWGDGYKNYYTLAYYVRYDTGTHFSGMNYPYGEHIIFTDNQPLLAWILKGVARFYPPVWLHIHSILSALALLSIVIAAGLLYKILKEFEVTDWLAVTLSSFIAMLSPQMQRFSGHFSLSYSFFIPLVLLLLIKLLKHDKDLKYGILIIITITTFSFLHLYYLGMALLFLLPVALLLLIIKRNAGIKAWSKPLWLIGGALAPLMVVKLFLHFTDRVADRPQIPWGFVASRSRIVDIFLSQKSFTNAIGHFILPRHANIQYTFEGYGYIGFIPVLVLLAAGIFWVLKPQKRWHLYKELYPFNYIIPAALVVLLFAMAFPFCISAWFERLFEYMPMSIKQFRASGRFNWVFYYTATVTTAIIIDRALKAVTGRKAYIAYFFAGISIFVWWLEVNMINNSFARQFKANSYKIDVAGESNSWIAGLAKAGKKPSDYQAIMPIPFFLNGSEKLYLSSEVEPDAMKASLYFGLPIAGGEMSRTSESATFRIANLLSSPYLKKDILAAYNKKPLLEASIPRPYTPTESYLSYNARKLFNVGELTFSELPLSLFADSTGAAKTFVSQNKSNLSNHGNYLSTDTIDNVVLKTFDDQPTGIAVFGKGAAQSEKGTIWLYVDTLPHAKDSTQYEISLWAYSDNRRAAFPAIYISQVNQSGAEIMKVEVEPKASTNTFGQWVRCTYNTMLYNAHNKIFVSYGDFHTACDEFMIRPVNTVVVSHFKNDSTFLFNNFPIY